MVSVCFPFTALLVALAQVGTFALLGEAWQPMIPMLVVLGLVGFAQNPGITVGTIYMTTGRTDLMMRWGVAIGALAILAFWIGAHWGVLGVALGYAVFQYGVTYPTLRVPLRLIGLRVSDVWHVCAHPAVGSLLAAAIAWWIADRTEARIGALGAVISGASGGLLVYLLWSVTLWSAISLRIARPGGSRIKH